MKRLQNLEPPFELNTVRTEILALNQPSNYIDLVKPQDGGDNEILHVIRRKVNNHRTIPQELLVNGSKHRTDYTHWYYRDYMLLMKDWERRTRDVGRRVLVREGAFPFWSGLHSGVDATTSIGSGSDAGLANMFARSHDIPMVSGDFPYYGDIVAQATLYPERIDEIITYYSMREIPIYARMESSNMSFEEFFKQRLEMLQRNMGKLAMTTYVPDRLDFSYDTVLDLHRKFFNGEDPNLGLTDTYLNYTVADLGDEELRKKDVARVAIDRMNLSDAHLLLMIQYQIRQGRDVMTIFGNHHTLAICRALGANAAMHSVPLPRYPGVRGDIKRASWNQAGRTKDFQDSVLIYPPEDTPQRIRPGELESYMRPKVLTEEHRSKYAHVWPNLLPSPGAHVPDMLQTQGIKALAGLEEARQFEDNAYITQLCQEPIEWLGDMSELFHILEYEGEMIRPDPELAGKNEDLAGMRGFDPHDLRGIRLLPSSRMILTNAEQRIKDIFGGETSTELSSWLQTVSEVIERTCCLKELPATVAIDRINMITKQVAGLCKLFRTVPAFCELDLSAREQCSYALSFLSESLKKDFWPLKRLDRIADLPYHVLPEYIE